MTIQLFPRKDFKGDGISITSNIPDLGDTDLRGSPSSMRLTSADDKVLLFKKKNFDGSCIFRKGPAEIEDLGKNSVGGKIGFGVGISSVRITPFSVDVRATIIKNAAGELPAQLTTEFEAASLVQDAMNVAKDRWSPFLLELNLVATAFKTDDRHFDVTANRLVRFPLDFYVKDLVNIFFINAFREASGVLGVTRPPCLGELVSVAMVLIFPDGSVGLLGAEPLGVVAAHELGHHFGIHHPSGKDDPNNIMHVPFDSARSDVIRNLTNDQVSEVHTSLSRNPARRGQRQG